MVQVLKFIVFSCIILLNQGYETKVSRKNVFLSRRKRYLSFPKGSSFLITISAVKAFLQVQPRGWNFLFEMDFPFALPSDTRFYKNKNRHYIERRDIYSQLDLGLTENGFNGAACVRRMICDSQKYIPSKGKSLVKDLLLALFTYSEGDCDETSWMECSIPFLDYVTKSVENRGNYVTE